MLSGTHFIKNFRNRNWNHYFTAVTKELFEKTYVHYQPQHQGQRQKVIWSKSRQETRTNFWAYYYFVKGDNNFFKGYRFFNARYFLNWILCSKIHSCKKDLRQGSCMWADRTKGPPQCLAAQVSTLGKGIHPSSVHSWSALSSQEHALLTAQGHTARLVAFTPVLFIAGIRLQGLSWFLSAPAGHNMVPKHIKLVAKQVSEIRKQNDKFILKVFLLGLWLIFCLFFF